MAAEEAMARANSADLAVLQCTSAEDSERALAGADVALVNFAPITAKVIQAMRPGATVVRYGIGYDNVDIDAAKAHGVQVANVPDYGSETVADHTIACLLALARKLPVYSSAIRAKGWIAPGDAGPVLGMSQHVIGLIGFGRIGQHLAARLAPFSCQVIACDPGAPASAFERMGVEQVSHDELLSRATAISLHAPAIPETHHLVNQDFLDACRPGVLLVNTSRGPLIDEIALNDAIVSGKVAGAALDVFDPEPLLLESPLRGHDQVILTPHAAFYSEESVQRLQQLAADEAHRALNGQPLNSRIA